MLIENFGGKASKLSVKTGGKFGVFSTAINFGIAGARKIGGETRKFSAGIRRGEIERERGRGEGGGGVQDPLDRCSNIESGVTRGDLVAVQFGDKLWLRGIGWDVG